MEDAMITLFGVFNAAEDVGTDIGICLDKVNS